MAKVSLAQVPALISAYKNRMDAVVKQSTQDVCKLAQTPQVSWKERTGGPEQGKIPVDLENLRNSFTSSLNGGGETSGEDSWQGVVTSMKAGDVADFGWTAEYAARINYGFTDTDSLGRTYNQTGAHFLEGATDQWQSIVAKNVARVRSKVTL